MDPQLRSPSVRECELCGRKERWDEDGETWRIATVDDDRRVGDPYCIHEWDINGKFAPFENW